MIYFAIVAAHQLTPYMALASLGVLAALDLVRPRWLVILMAAIAGHTSRCTTAHCSRLRRPVQRRQPDPERRRPDGTYHAGADATTQLIVRVLAGGMWLSTLVAILRQRRALGRVVIPGGSGIQPFLVLGAQNYGGEAINRVFLFSAPWCAVLIAGTCRVGFSASMASLITA